MGVPVPPFVCMITSVRVDVPAAVIAEMGVYVVLVPMIGFVRHPSSID